MKHHILSLGLLLSATILAMEQPAPEMPSSEERQASPDVFAARPAEKKSESNDKTNDDSRSSEDHRGHGCALDPERKEKSSSEASSNESRPRVRIQVGGGSPFGNPFLGADADSPLGGLGGLLALMSLLGSRDRTETSSFEQLQQNANRIHDILAETSPIVLAWLKTSDQNADFSLLKRSYAALRGHIDTQDRLLTDENKKAFAPTQAFQRLYEVSTVLNTARQQCVGEAAAACQAFRTANPGHDITSFERMVVPLHASLELIKNSANAPQV